MEAELNTADLALDAWLKAQQDADGWNTRHKHHTAAEVNAHAVGGSVAKAKETVLATENWLNRQIQCDAATTNAQAAKYRYDMAIRRWETARSLFSAGRKVV